jgi:hypothetical protein
MEITLVTGNSTGEFPVGWPLATDTTAQQYWGLFSIWYALGKAIRSRQKGNTVSDETVKYGYWVLMT